MPQKIRHSSILALAGLALAGLALTACNRAPDQPGKTAAAPSGVTTANAATLTNPGGTSLLLAQEDLYAVRSSNLSSGPAITGSIQPERRADLRAEVSAVVMQILKENGDVVHRGDLLVRLDDTAIRDSLASATSTSRSAALTLEQTERQYQRMVTLRGSGMASAQQLEDAENRRNSAQSDLEAAKSREVLARQQLQRTEVRAPFDGIVSDRRASAGDSTQIGKELVKVIDPNSMRFEGLVSADSIGSVRVGEPVMFRVNGYGTQQFQGKIRRVNPAANPTTRQVEVLVDFIDKKQPKLAGLYAEGRIESERASGLTIPASALAREGDKAYAWQIKGDTVKKVGINLGPRDERTGEFSVKTGLAEGDTLIRVVSTSLKDGQKVEMAAAKKAEAALTDARK